MIVRIRVPSWTAGVPTVLLNGAPLHDAVLPAGGGLSGGGLSGGGLSGGGLSGGGLSGGGRGAGGWATVGRQWKPGDWLEVTLPMRLGFSPAPDNPAVQAVTYGPVVLSGLYGASYAQPRPSASGAAANPSSAAAGSHPDSPAPLPVLAATSVRRTATSPMTFEATADGQPVTMVPVARAQHEPYTVYWRTE